MNEQWPAGSQKTRSKNGPELTENFPPQGYTHRQLFCCKVIASCNETV